MLTKVEQFAPVTDADLDKLSQIASQKLAEWLDLREKYFNELLSGGPRTIDKKQVRKLELAYLAASKKRHMAGRIKSAMDLGWKYL